MCTMCVLVVAMVMCYMHVMPYNILYNFSCIYSMDVLSGNLKWSLYHKDPCYGGYSLLALSETLSVIALGNINGLIKAIVINEHSKG